MTDAILLFLIYMVACFGGGATGAAFPPGPWYLTLNKPAWTPPNWVFPLAWTTIYLLISFAGARAALLPDNGYAMAFWAAQVALMTLWTPIFFGLRRLWAAVGVIVPLWLAVLGATIAHWQLDTWAGLAFLPYLAWVTVAAALNVSVARRNPGVAPYKPWEA